ncbi:cyanophycinase [Krasilnikovia sp. M28-CT-15]|uniref:cyanophycinase n=1 Tax=Krasilnikovia sp. M28-CT-15 TaxID=3373540 RepID=UPI00387650C2
MSARLSSLRVVPALLCAATVAIGPMAVPDQAHAARRPGGSLVLVGGGLSDDNAAVYDDIVRLAGGSGRARIGIVTAAASVPAEDPDAGTPDCNNSVCNGDYYAALFQRYGAQAEWIPIDLDHVAAADDPAVVAQINRLSGFFFGGGDQYRYVTTMKRAGGADSAALAAIRARLHAGAVVAGTSAGAQIQAGRDMVSGGESYEGLRDGSAPGYFDDATKLGYLPDGGFGFFQAGLLDTHFSHRGRWGRSARLAADTGHDRVFGLDQDTALEVTGVGGRHESMRVLGASGVHVLDLRRAEARTGEDGWSISGVRWTRLSDGDGYDARVWRLRTGKPVYRGTAPGCPAAVADVFGREVLSTLAGDLAGRRDCRTAAGRTSEQHPAFVVDLRRDQRFTAYGVGSAATYRGLRVSIHGA